MLERRQILREIAGKRRGVVRRGQTTERIGQSTGDRGGAFEEVRFVVGGSIDRCHRRGIVFVGFQFDPIEIQLLTNVTIENDIFRGIQTETARKKGLLANGCTFVETVRKKF